MNFKVTIELEEGTKETVQGGLTSEAVIVSSEMNKPFGFRERLIEEASRAAEKAMCKLYNKAASCRIVEFTLNNHREIVYIEDVRHLPEDSKQAALKAIDKSIVSWNNNKVKNIKTIEREKRC